MKKILKRSALVLMVLVVALVTGLMINNRIQTNSDIDALDMKGTQHDTESGSFRVHDFGEGANLVFLSGLGTTSPYHDFKPLWHDLEESYRIIIIERPGYGYNQTTSSNKEMASVVDGYREVLESLDVTSPLHVVAHSMGGLEALLWAQTHPDEIDSMIGLDIAIPPLLVERGAPGLIERNLNFMLGALGLARFMEEEDLERTMPILSMDVFDDAEKEAITTLFHANMFNRDIVRESKALEDNAETIMDRDLPNGLSVLHFISEENLDAHGIEAGYFADYFDFSEPYESEVLETHHYVHHEASETINSAIRTFVDDLEN